jgi:hypothetical protein
MQPESARRRGVSPNHRVQPVERENEASSYAEERTFPSNEERGNEIVAAIEHLNLDTTGSRGGMSSIINRLNEARQRRVVNVEVNPTTTGGNETEDVQEALRSVQAAAPFVILLLVKLMYEHALSAVGFLILSQWRFDVEKKFTDQVSRSSSSMSDNKESQ